MSDAKLPAEGVVVLAWGVDYASLVYRASGMWWDFMEKRVTHVAIDGWVSIPHAKAAGRLAEACMAALGELTPGTRVACFTTEQRERERVIGLLRAVLREIGT